MFFDFRSSLDFNANDLSLFDPYINYLLNYLNQEVLDSGQNYFLAQQESEHNYKRMQLIDAAIKGEDLRNNLSRAVALEEILNFENHKLHSDFLDLYFKINSSPSYLKEVTAIHKDIDDLRIGAQLPEIELQNSSMKKVKSNLFRWTPSSHLLLVANRNEPLQKNHSANPKTTSKIPSIPFYRGLHSTV